MWTIFCLYWTFYNIASGLCSGFLVTRHVGSWFPDQGSNPHPLQWKRGVLTAGLPGKSLHSLKSGSEEWCPRQQAVLLRLCVQLARAILFFLPLQVWQCGGKIEVLPCSRVAHLERHHKPYSLDLRIPLKRNALRVAEIWMDEYKDMVYMAWNIPLQVRPGWDRSWEGWRRRKGRWSWWEWEGTRAQA